MFSGRNWWVRRDDAETRKVCSLSMTFSITKEGGLDLTLTLPSVPGGKARLFLAHLGTKVVGYSFQKKEPRFKHRPCQQSQTSEVQLSFHRGTVTLCHQTDGLLKRPFHLWLHDMGEGPEAKLFPTEEQEAVVLCEVSPPPLLLLSFSKEAASGTSSPRKEESTHPFDVSHTFPSVDLNRFSSWPRGELQTRRDHNLKKGAKIDGKMKAGCPYIS